MVFAQNKSIIDINDGLAQINFSKFFSNRLRSFLFCKKLLANELLAIPKCRQKT
jgi:hypothetical protein